MLAHGSVKSCGRHQKGIVSECAAGLSSKEVNEMVSKVPEWRLTGR